MMNPIADIGGSSCLYDAHRMVEAVEGDDERFDVLYSIAQAHKNPALDAGQRHALRAVYVKELWKIFDGTQDHADRAGLTSALLRLVR